jgi:pimeloyl-ACP methyl ester carboxylesterase
VPLVVHRAYEGDFVPFEAVAIRSSLGGLVARGMYLAVTCAEGVPFITDSEVVASARGTFVGETRVRRHLDACKAWPAGHVPPTFIEPVKSDAPVLMISGELDGSTPPSLGEGAVRFLPNGRQIRIRYTGHQIDSPCVWGIMQAFIRKASVAGLDTACVTQIRRPPFATELPKPLQLP